MKISAFRTFTGASRWCLVFVFASAAWGADILKLKNGTTLEGTYVREDATAIVFRSSKTGTNTAFARSAVAELVRENADVVPGAVKSDASEDAVDPIPVAIETPMLSNDQSSDASVDRGVVADSSSDLVNITPAPDNVIAGPASVDPTSDAVSSSLQAVMPATPVPETSLDASDPAAKVVPVDSSEDNALLQRLYFSGQLDWNGAVGLGPMLEVALNNRFSALAGAGVGLWGGKVSVGSRYYLDEKRRFALSASLVRNTGMDDTQTMGVVRAGGVQQESVSLKLLPVTVVNLGVVAFREVGSGLRGYLEIGYSHSLGDDTPLFRVKGAEVLADPSNGALKNSIPGGLLIAVGFGKPLFDR